MDSPNRPLPGKKDVALVLLEGPSLFIHLDPRKPGVSVPPWFKKQPQLVLQVGLNMAIPIPDLRVDDDGVSCTLSFNRSPFFCKMPWSAVFALVGEDGRAMVWPAEVPPEVAAQFERVVRPAPAPAPAPAPTVAAAPAREPRAAGKPAKAKEPKGKKRATTAAKPRPPKRPAAPAATQAAAPAPAAPAKKPGTKRELPPYLRVVK